MKKNILIIILALALQSYSQVNLKNIDNVPMASPIEIVNVPSPPAMGGDDVLWSEDFANSDIPNIYTEDVAGFGGWHWGDDSPGGMWSENAGVISSETPDNGFMIMEADFYNSSPQNNIIEGVVGENALNANFTIGPIDLSASETEQLVLQFYSNYRICCYYSPSPNNDLNVYISTDGGNTFSDLNYIEGETFEVNVEKETLSQIPLGAFAPNTDNVYFKFEWIGTHYFWMIDDLSIIQRPAYDLQMKSAWLTMANPTNIEYYSIPESQMPEEMLIGAEVYNYGYSTEDQMVLTGTIEDQGISTELYSTELLNADSTGYIESNYFDVSMLTAGEYTFTAEILSTGDDSNTDDNMLSRDFVISENEYAIDGLYEIWEWMGTGWPGGDDTADGVRYANFFDIKDNTTLSSITIALNTAEHPTSLGTFQTEPGGEIIAYVCDTTGIWDPDVETLGPEFGGAIWISDFYLVSQDDVDNGRIVIDVDEFQLPPDAYYVVIEMYSNGLDSDILIWDDTSVPQPWWASLVFYPEDQTWYSNPNAASIRIGLDGFENIGLEEVLEESGIQFFPNPANNHIDVISDKLIDGLSSIAIYNMLGEEVKKCQYSNFGNNQIINSEGLKSGSYILEFENKNTLSRHKLIIE